MITLLTSNLLAWSLFDNDEIYKGGKTYNLLMAGTGHNKNFLKGVTLFASPVVTHLEETLTIIQNRENGVKYILESSSYKKMLKSAKFQCSVNQYSDLCKIYKLSIIAIKTAIKQKENTTHSHIKSSPVNNINIEKSLKLKILRNLPYANRGYIFKSNDLMNFYKTQKWYKPNSDYQAKLSDLTKQEQVWRQNILSKKKYSQKNFMKYLNEYTVNFINTNQNINDFDWLEKPHIVRNIVYKGFSKNKIVKNKTYEKLIPFGTKGNFIQILKNGDGYFLPNGKKSNDLIVNSEKIMEGGILYMEFLESDNNLLDTCYQKFSLKCKFLRHWSEYKYRIDAGI